MQLSVDHSSPQTSAVNLQPNLICRKPQQFGRILMGQYFLAVLFQLDGKPYIVHVAVKGVQLYTFFF